MNKILRSIYYPSKRFFEKVSSNETQMIALGTLLSNQQYQMTSRDINDYEFKIFSQWGDDGIIQFLIKTLNIENETFIEFGVEDYSESNTRFLLMNNNWSGYILDGSTEAMNHVKNQPWFWRQSLRCKDVFIDAENINELLAESGFTNLGILSIDIDGNDYHVLKAIDFSNLNPSILILEYNAVFGAERPISVPYKKDFFRTTAHFSNLYFGASLPALNMLAEEKSYSLVGCTKAGNNAYFIRKDLLNDKIQKKTVAEAFIDSKFTESRDKNYKLSFLRGAKRLEVMKGMEVLNVESGQLESL